MPWTCCILSLILLEILGSQGGGGNDGREALDPVDFFVTMSHATK